jgi:hypothetical protein
MVATSIGLSFDVLYQIQIGSPPCTDFEVPASSYPFSRK